MKIINIYIDFEKKKFYHDQSIIKYKIISFMIFYHHQFFIIYSGHLTFYLELYC